MRHDGWMKIFVVLMSVILSGCATASRESCYRQTGYKTGYSNGSMSSEVITAKEAFDRSKEHITRVCQSQFGIDVTTIEKNWLAEFERGFNQSRKDLASKYCGCEVGFVSAANDEFLTLSNDTARMFNYETLKAYCPPERFQKFVSGWSSGLPMRTELTTKMASSFSEYLFSDGRRETAWSRARTACAKL